MFNKFVIISFAVITLSVLSTVSVAQQPYDGNWVKKGLDAYNRVHVTRNSSDEDMMLSIAFIGYLSGMISVHRINNLAAQLILGSIPDSKLLPKEKSILGNTTLAFVPLIDLPDVSEQQIVAILQKYLDTHPEKWGTQATILVTDALKEAFSKK